MVKIDRDRLISALKEESTCQFPFAIHIYDTVSSTNSVLWELIDRGSTEGTVVIAAQQTAGRGQRGHQWRSPLGGLYLSLALTPDLDAQKALLLTISSAWGIATTLRQLSSSSCSKPVDRSWARTVVRSPQTPRSKGGFHSPPFWKGGFGGDPYATNADHTPWQKGEKDLYL